MATNTLIGTRHNVVRIPRSTDNGLWNALASHVTRAPATGTALVAFDVVAFVAPVTPAA